MRSFTFALVLLCASAVTPQPAQAQPSEPDSPDEVGEAFVEDPDPTRLDVERLPADVAPLERDLFARGGYLDAHLGARGFLGDVGEVAQPGPLLMIAGGYELASWFAMGAAFAGSLHETSHQTPPSETAFEVYEVLGQMRLTAPFGVQAALWLRAEGGLFASTGDVLRALGFLDGDNFSTCAGGALGFDWHARARHHSFGLEAGARWLPDLQLDSYSLSVHATVYVHYVF